MADGVEEQPTWVRASGMDERDLSALSEAFNPTEGAPVNPHVVHVTDCVRVTQTSSDGEWLDGYAVEWRDSPDEDDWGVFCLPMGATAAQAMQVAEIYADILTTRPKNPVANS